MITLLPKVFTAYRHGGSRAEYTAADHTDISKDIMILTSNSPKLNKDSYGTRRSEVKTVQSVTVNTPDNVSESRDQRFSIAGSVPVGATLADIKAQVAPLIVAMGDDAFLTDTFLLGRIVK